MVCVLGKNKTPRYLHLKGVNGEVLKIFIMWSQFLLNNSKTVKKSGKVDGDFLKQHEISYLSLTGNYNNYVFSTGKKLKTTSFLSHKVNIVA